jgi:hypothetical protein
MCANIRPAGLCVEQICRVGEFDLDCEPDTAFPLFSPEGERDWVSDWDPKPVFPEQITFERDTVFHQGVGAEEALWIILDVDWRAHRAEYVRVLPRSHSARIVVAVKSADSGRSHVTVSYTVTAFGHDQTQLLEAFSEDAYAAKMLDWRQRISFRLANR